MRRSWSATYIRELENVHVSLYVLTLHLPDADEIKGTYTQPLNGLPKYWGGGTIYPPAAIALYNG